MPTSIRSALSLMFGVMAVVTGLQGFITYERLTTAESDVDSVAERQLASLAAVRDIGSGFLRIRTSQFRLVLSEPIADVVRNNDIELQNDIDDVEAARRRYEGLIASDEERDLFRRGTTTLENYLKLAAPLRELMKAGKIEAAQQLLLKPWLRVLFRSVDSVLQAEIRLIEKRARANSMASVAALTQAKMVALLAAVAAAALAASAIAVSYWRILKPLSMVTRALNQLAQGDIAAKPLTSRRRDEIGAIGRAVEAFRSSLIRTREAEAQRLESQLFVENIAASTPDGMVAVDHRGVVTFWNLAAESLLGIPAEAIVGHSLTDVIGDGWLSAPVRDERHGRFEADLPHRSGEMIPVEISFSRWSQAGHTMSCAILRDIRSRRRDDAILNKLAHTDFLTGLPNRLVLMSRMSAVLADGRPLTVMILDLDHFKQVNDAFGHQVGDEILKVTAQRLLDCVGTGGLVTRIGGDEFVVLLEDRGDPLEAAMVADAMLQRLGEPFGIKQHTIHLGSSIGMVLAPSQGRNPEELVSYADMALYAVKAEGRNGRRLFTPELRDAAMRDSLCRQQIPRAVERGEFTLFFQPQVRLHDGSLAGAEALIRWQHPDFGLLAPNRFITVLESSPHAEEVGNWVIRTACSQVARWRSIWPDFRVGVNLSGAHFRSGRLAETVRRILAEFDLPPSALELEITENVILRHDDQMIAPLKELHELGVSIAFDDYGTGYASLSLLKRFPLSRLKIDRSFVSNMDGSTEDAAIVRTILTLGRSLGLDVIAEGIETADEAARLRQEGCYHGQGYFFGRPMPADVFEVQCATQSGQATRRA